MPMNRLNRFSVTVQYLLSGGVLTAALVFTAVPRLHAEDYDRCQRRVAHADHELHRAIEKHGRNSPQANRERRELREAREHCWSQPHQWWELHGRARHAA